LTPKKTVAGSEAAKDAGDVKVAMEDKGSEPAEFSNSRPFGLADPCQ
jgi:hypothetical protein